MTRPRDAEKAYTPEEVAELKSVSISYVRAAMKATEGNYLRAVNIAKTDKQPRYRINASDVEAWWGRMSEA